MKKIEKEKRREEKKLKSRAEQSREPDVFF
jgi:hypothetical protein